ncbi:MAG: glycoside hydrolase family 28 protein [candidate division KSB1 bacterium]|nr:glycoside hydrolase family 28 protein [candidate division KSB1 bacterium]
MDFSIQKRKSLSLWLSILLFTSGASHVHSFSQVSDKTGIFNIRDFGAAGDGVRLDTRAIQAAIDDCAKTGGTVIVPPGQYLSGTIFLRSNVTLQFMAGATLLGSTDISDYPATTPDYRFYGDEFSKFSLIYGENLDQIALIGEGTIDGQGGAFKVTTKKKPDRYFNRPYVIWLVNCRNVRVENLTLRNSARWMQHYLACDNLTIRGIHVYNHCNQNNDMIDIDGCHNVVISDCIGDSDDDAITLKSTSGRACENIAITNCVVSSHCNAIKLGTESHGGFKNITISNCVVKPSQDHDPIFGFERGIGGIVLTMVDGGMLDGVLIQNIRIDGPKVPIFLRLGDRGRVYREDLPRPAIGIFRNVQISHVIANAADSIGCSITGLPDHPIENIGLSHIQITFKGGGQPQDAFKHVPELPDHYPESTMFGQLPAYGFYIRHAKDIRLNEIDLRVETADHRPALVGDDVQGMDVTGFRAAGTMVQWALITLRNTQDVMICGSRPIDDVRLFLSVHGENSSDIILSGNDFHRCKNIFKVGDGAKKSDVKIR